MTRSAASHDRQAGPVRPARAAVKAAAACKARTCRAVRAGVAQVWAESGEDVAVDRVSGVPATGVAVGLDREPAGFGQGERVAGFLRGQHGPVDDTPQQVGRGLVGQEHLGQAEDVGEQCLGAEAGLALVGAGGQLGVADQVGQQAADDGAMVWGGVSSLPGHVEAGRDVLEPRTDQAGGRPQRAPGPS
jgi:hypothetical protein